MLDNLNADLLIHVVSHMNVVDSGRFTETSKRMYYLVHQYRTILGPQLVASSSIENGETRPISCLYKDCISKLSIRPNLAIAFYTIKGRELSSQLRQHMPSDSVVVGARANNIQANIHGDVQCESPAAIMMGSLSTEQTCMVPFSLLDGNFEILTEQIQNVTPKGGERIGSYWKVFVVYACGTGYYSVGSFVSDLQAKYPQAAIVGGVCDKGFISKHFNITRKELKRKDVVALKKLLELFEGVEDDTDNNDKDTLVEKVFDFMNRKKYHVVDIEDGIFGLALGGDVPMKSIVSRGVRSLTRNEIFLSEAPSEWYVYDVSLLLPLDEDYPFRGPQEALKPIHVIRSVWNSVTERVTNPMELLSQLEDQPDYVGIRRSGADGFELQVFSSFSRHTNDILLMTDGSEEQIAPLEKANLDFFSLDPKACLDHLDMTLGKLKERTKDDVILGCIMFSCNGRGPQQRCMLGERMADAKRFSDRFPKVPCLGLYAGGEIGPIALVGNRDVFQKGRATVQGFTAVFALFIVPEVTPGAFHFDDSDQNVATFLKDRLASRDESKFT